MLPPTNKYSARPLPQFSRRHVCPLGSHILLAQKPPVHQRLARKAQKLQWPFESSTDDLHCFCWSPGWHWTDKKTTREWPSRFQKTGKCHFERNFPQSHVRVGLGAKGHGFSCFFLTCSKKMSIHRMIPKDVCQWLDFNNTTNCCTRTLTVGWRVGHSRNPRKTDPAMNYTCSDVRWQMFQLRQLKQGNLLFRPI